MAKLPKVRRIIYSRGFPYGAPLVMVRGGGTRWPSVHALLKEQGFTWNPQRYAWEHYMDRRDFGAILKTLRDEHGCEVVPKAGMDAGYLIDLDNPDFRRPKED